MDPKPEGHELEVEDFDIDDDAMVQLTSAIEAQTDECPFE